jgi:hypothetical protein
MALNLPAGEELSCSVRLHNTGNVGLIDVTVTGPVSAADCTKSVLEPGDEIVCSATVNIPANTSATGDILVQLEAQALNRVDDAIVVGHAAKSVPLKQTRSLAVTAVVQPEQISAAGKAVRLLLEARQPSLCFNSPHRQCQAPCGLAGRATSQG